MGSTPATIVNPMTSGMTANADTVPARQSPRILEIHSDLSFLNTTFRFMTGVVFSAHISLLSVSSDRTVVDKGQDAEDGSRRMMYVMQFSSGQCILFADNYIDILEDDLDAVQSDTASIRDSRRFTTECRDSTSLQKGLHRCASSLRISML